MTTTKKTKMRACLDLKEMVEKNTIKLVSPILVAELKEYARKAGSYAARSGSTDDCISAMLIIMRVLKEMASFEQSAFDKLHGSKKTSGVMLIMMKTPMMHRLRWCFNL